MSESELKLEPNSTVAVIGAGPAGTFFCHFMQNHPRFKELGIKLAVFDKKSFLKTGTPGCNMCAGVIGRKLVSEMCAAGIDLPQSVIRHEIKGYVLHYYSDWAVLPMPPEETVYTVFRGRNPVSAPHGRKSFDQHLLDIVVARGAEYIPQNISEIEMPGDSRSKATLHYDFGRKKLDADLIAGCFGINTGLGDKMPSGYRPPEHWVAAQGEIYASEEFLRDVYQDMIHAFNYGWENLKFMALVPKGNFITVSAIGKNIDRRLMWSLLQRDEIKPYLPENWSIVCSCRPQIPVSAAQGVLSDRLITIGDACCARYLKNGIESAFYGARSAVETVLEHGIAAGDFKELFLRHYVKPLDRDNRYGKLLFAVNDVYCSSTLFSKALLEVVRSESERPEAGKTTDYYLWQLFSGDVPYKKILCGLLRPVLVARVAVRFFRNLFKSLCASTGKPLRVTLGLKRVKLQLHDDATIVIIGGGPAGSSCALKLKQLMAQQNKHNRVVIYENKDFERHYNQCMGVLSPPLLTVLRDELNLKLPAELVKTRTEGYWLFGDHEGIFLRNTSEELTVVVRRSEFDNFLLTTAGQAGVDIIHSRVTGVEFLPEDEYQHARCYSESGCIRKVDVIVGAFGLDVHMSEQLRLRTGRKYTAPPKTMRTYITKITLPPEFITRKYSQSVYAFLTSELPLIEFAALTPKDNYIVVNITGTKISSVDMDKFLNLLQRRSMLPDFDKDNLEYYEGRFPISRARRACGDRYVTIGDSTGWMRSYKGKGINTAVTTGIRAAECIMKHGVDASAFENYRDNCKELRKDYIYGAIFRIATRFVKNRGAIDRYIRLVKKNSDFKEVLYKAVSGEDSFRNIIRLILKRRLAWKMIWSLLKG